MIYIFLRSFFFKEKVIKFEHAVFLRFDICCFFKFNSNSIAKKGEITLSKFERKNGTVIMNDFYF